MFEGIWLRLPPATMATAMVSPSARPRPSTEAPTMPVLIHGRVTRRAHSKSDMPSAIAPSRGRIGTPRIRSRVVDATIGMIMMARMSPEVSSPWPCPGSPRKKLSTGTSGAWLAIQGVMWWARNGPKVSAPNRPMTTLGTPASISRNRPRVWASRLGSRSTIISAAPTDTGMPMISAIAEDSRVPTICGSAPNDSPGWCTMPPLSIGWPYWAPNVHVLPVKNVRPLNLIAGIASISRTIRIKASRSSGMIAPPRPAHRIKPLNRNRLRVPPGRRRSGLPAPPSGPAAGAEVAIRSGTDARDQVLRDGRNAVRQRLEAHRVQVLRVGPVSDGPLQEGLERVGHPGAGLLLLHDHVLVVDDRVALGVRRVDQRLGAGGRDGTETGQRGSDRVAGRLGELAGLVGQGGLAQTRVLGLGQVADADVGDAALDRLAPGHHAAAAGLGLRRRTGRPADRGADRGDRPVGGVLGVQVGGEQERAARALRAVQGGDLQGGQVLARVKGFDGRVVPGL